MDRTGGDTGRSGLLTALVVLGAVAGFVILVSALFLASSQSSPTTLELPTLTTVVGDASTTDGVAPPAGATDGPPVTVTEFYPENANLSDCVGLVEKPGCGSESRGGTGQTLVFVALAIGLGVVFWRIARGVRANRPDGAASVDPVVESQGGAGR